MEAAIKLGFNVKGVKGSYQCLYKIAKPVIAHLILEDESTVEQIAQDLPPGIEIEPAEAQKNAVKQMTAAFELNLQALSLLALVVGMFLIYNTATFSVVQRRSLFGGCQRQSQAQACVWVQEPIWI